MLDCRCTLCWVCYIFSFNSKLTICACLCFVSELVSKAVYFFIYLHMPPSKRWCFEWIVFTLFQFVSLLLKCKAKSIARSFLTRLSHIHWISMAVVIAMQSKSNSLNWICCHLHCTHFRAHKIDLWIAERLQIICLNGNFLVSLH